LQGIVFPFSVQKIISFSNGILSDAADRSYFRTRPLPDKSNCGKALTLWRLVASHTGQ
jgi:hypothetical protein